MNKKKEELRIFIKNINVCQGITQRQKYIVSAGALLPGKFLRGRKYFALKILLFINRKLMWKITEVFFESYWEFLESFQIVLNISELSGKVLFCLKIFCTFWKV